MNTRNGWLASFTDNELKTALADARKDAAYCRLALETGIEVFKGKPIKMRLEEDEAEAEVITEELARRASAIPVELHRLCDAA